MESFDYSGFSEKKLLRLSSEFFAYTGLASWRYSGAELYSSGRHLRDYARYPAWLPVYCYATHGAGPEGYPTAKGKYNIPEHELTTSAHSFLTFDAERAEELREVLSIPVHNIISPFAWYRRKNNIIPSPQARGTLAFPAHASSSTDVVSDIEEYIEELKQLPEKYHPICICCFWREILQGEHKVYMKHGFPVYTAGYSKDMRFAERWYDIVRHFKYTTSHAPGSFILYSVELGVPFFLYGKPPKYFQRSTEGAPPEEYYALQRYENVIKFAEMFKERLDAVSEEQTRCAEKYMGINTTISREELNRVLWDACKARFKWHHLLWLPGTPFRYLRVKSRPLRNYIRGLFGANLKKARKNS